VTIAYPGNIEDPLGDEWTLEESALTLLKYSEKYDADLKLNKIVTSSKDIMMTMKTKLFKAGRVEINLKLIDPTHFLLLLGGGTDSSKIDCGGGEILFSQSNN